MTARSFMGAGDIYINRMVGGVSQGMVGPIHAGKFEIKPSVDVKEATSKGRYSYGQVLDTVNLAKPTDFTIDLSEVTGDILVMAFLGTSDALNQTSGTLTAQHSWKIEERPTRRADRHEYDSDHAQVVAVASRTRRTSASSR